MPCLILTGHPSVGKTTLAEKIKEYALKHSSGHIQSVVIVNEATACPGLTQAQCYQNSHNEKKTRGALKACFDQAVVGGNNNDTTTTADKNDKQKQKQKQQQLIILDSLNYIKGFRYELFCISKASGEQHGVIWVMNHSETAQEWNRERNTQAETTAAAATSAQRPQKKTHAPFYTDRSMTELIQRFEPPDERNRWDKPLYKVDMRPAEVKRQQKQQQTSLTSTSATAAEGDILEKSVYNMHALSDVMGNVDATNSVAEATTGDADEVAVIATTTTTNNDAIATSVPKKKKGFKGFKRAPKIAKPQPPTMVAPGATPPSAAPTPTGPSLNSLNIDDTTAVLYPKNFLFSTQPSEEPFQLFLNDNDTNSNDNDIRDNYSSTHVKEYKYAGPPKRRKKPPVVLPPKPDPLSSVDDQVNAILDSFLLHVEPLKEGTSTQRPAVNGSANVLHEMDAITQSVCDAIVQGQTHGTGTSGQVLLEMAGRMTQQQQQSLFLTANRSLPQAELRRLRRQYLRWVATHPPDDCDTEFGIAKSFVTYIEAQL